MSKSPKYWNSAKRYLKKKDKVMKLLINKYSEVSLVTPLKYLALVFAIIFGYLFWDEIPTLKTLIGSVLVVFSSIIIFRREIYLKRLVSTSRHE